MNPRANGVAELRLGPRSASVDSGAEVAHSRLRVLFVCTGNSARSLLCEALLRHHGGGHFEVFSAGTHPAGVNPLTVRVLTEAGVPTDGLRSKSVNEYLDRSFDYVITVCDDARQVCPVFPGVHESLHWGYDDPSAVEGDEATRLAAFRRTTTAIGERVKQFATVVHRSAVALDRG